MKVLLLSMPDAIPLFYSYESFVPNLGIRSIAGNLNVKGVEVRYLDLIFFHKNVSCAVKKAIGDFRPNLVGISAMTFQYDTALKIAGIIKKLDKRVKIAIGGYHATLLHDEISGEAGSPFDYIIRNEGERSFNELIETLCAGGGNLANIKGLSFKNGGEYTHNDNGKLLDLDNVKPPRRDLGLFDLPPQAFGRTEVVETSRGCVNVCTFCSISTMYGNHFRKYRVERVLEDISAAKAMGANRILFADDNATLDMAHIADICEGIVEEGLNDIFYGIQLSSRGVAANEDLVKKMRDANVGVVFLGIENVSKDRLLELGKGDIVDDARRAINYLHKHDIGVMGGFIVGNPNDDLEDIKACFKFAKRTRVDILMAQYLTPYPKTVLRDRLLNMGLVEFRDDYSRYNGFRPVARTNYLSLKRLEKIMVRSNIIWYMGEIFNPLNWFARSKRVFRHVYLRVLMMTLMMVMEFIKGKYGKSFHRI